jgi:hypothetical protein
MMCWLHSKERFRKEYFENGEKLNTKYLRFGKGIAKMIESGTHKTLLPDLIVYECPEFEIRCDIGGVPMLSFLDSYNPVDNVFREYKTGKVAWTQSKVQKHEQLVVYATMLKQLTGKIPEYCDLDWIETKEGGLPIDDFWHENEGAINVTGKIESFHRVFDPREVERMEKLIVKTANEISEAYIKFIEEI